jgi:hypothetical protein
MYDDIRAIPLPKLKWDELNANMKMCYGTDSITDSDNEDLHERNAELGRMLQWLWNDAVRPVLQDLEYLSSGSLGKLPCIWRATNGLLGMAPLRAVGSNWGRSWRIPLPVWYLTCGPDYLHTRPSYGGKIAC